MQNITAMQIAGAWHSGCCSALYQLYCTGYIIENHLRYLQELESCLHPEFNLHLGELNKGQKEKLTGLKNYIIKEGEGNGIVTTWKKHPLYGYNIPFISDETVDSICKKITQIEYPL